MMAWGRVKGKGKGKGKGKRSSLFKGSSGKGSYNGGNFGQKGKSKELDRPSLDERRRKLAELKSRTSCQACGQRGHWAGDEGCPKGKRAEQPSSSSGASSRPNTSYFAVAESEPRPSGFQLGLTPKINGDGTIVEGLAMMHLGAPEADEEDYDYDMPACGAATADHQQGGDTKMAFGKYKGLNYQQVMDDHPDYLVCGKLQKTPSIYLQKFLDWATPGIGATTTRTPLRAPGSASLSGPGTHVPQA